MDDEALAQVVFRVKGQCSDAGVEIVREYVQEALQALQEKLREAERERDEAMGQAERWKRNALGQEAHLMEVRRRMRDGKHQSETIALPDDVSALVEKLEKAEARISDLEGALREAAEALDHLWAAIGDRLLAKGPLDQPYAASVSVRVRQARARAESLLSRLPEPSGEGGR